MRWQIVEEQTTKVSWVMEVEADSKEEALERWRASDYIELDEDEREILQREIVEINQLDEKGDVVKSDKVRIDVSD